MSATFRARGRLGTRCAHASAPGQTVLSSARGVFYLWLMLSFLLQRPLVAGLVVLAIWLVADRAWVRWRSPFKWWQRRQTLERLRRTLDVNPHNRDARFELAELLVDRGDFDGAWAVIEKNLEAGDSDAETLWLAGRAAFGSSHKDATETGERLLSQAREANPKFRSGAIDLELGRGRLSAQRFAEARDALQQAIEARPGSVEAHVLLARAQEGLGQSDEAAKTKATAWQLFGESPRFKRRQDRKWAWKAKPSAALRHYAIIVGVVAAIVVAIGMIPDREIDVGKEMWANQSEEGWNVDTADAPSATRFVLQPRNGSRTHPGAALVRSDMNRNNKVDLRRKLYIGDLWCRLITHYPDLEDAGPQDFDVEDTELGLTFSISANTAVYYSDELAVPQLLDSATAFEKLLESTVPDDCEATFGTMTSEVRFGIEDGEPFHIVGSN